LIDITHCCNVITHASNLYADAVTNLLVYGLRDYYVALLKSLNVNNHKLVALKLLHSFQCSNRANLSFKLNEKDVFEAERQRHNQAEIETQVVAERELMGNVDSYMSAFHFMRRIQERYNEVEGPSKHIKFVPENSIKSAFIRIDDTSVETLTALLSEDDEGLPTTLEEILSTKAKNTRRNSNLGKSFQTDGVQVKL